MNTKLLIGSTIVLLVAACNGTTDAPAGSGALRVTTAGTTVGEGGDPASLTCPSPTVCFDLATDGANITHVFIDVEACCGVDPDGYDVLVDGQPVTKLHTQGGPCDEIARDAWFPLQANQSSAEVCLQFHGFVPGIVSVGAKAKSECVSTPVTAACGVCGGSSEADGCGDAGTGGAGGAGGANGGSTGSGTNDMDAGVLPIPE